jgi:hypothetical protein
MLSVCLYFCIDIFLCVRFLSFYIFILSVSPSMRVPWLHIMIRPKADIFFGSWQLAVGSWAVGSWQLVVFIWQLAVDSWQLAVWQFGSLAVWQFGSLAV